MLMTLNEWLKRHGYQWVEGREEMYKAPMTKVELEELVSYLKAQGAIKRA